MALLYFFEAISHLSFYNIKGTCVSNEFATRNHHYCFILLLFMLLELVDSVFMLEDDRRVLWDFGQLYHKSGKSGNYSWIAV